MCGASDVAQGLLIALMKLYVPTRGPGAPHHSLGVLTNAQHLVVQIIAEEGPTRITDLAHALDVTISTMSVTVDRLVHYGLVRRTGARAGQPSLVKLTTRGAAAYRSSEASRQLAMQRWLEPLDETDRRALSSAVVVLWRLLRESETAGS